MTQTLRDLLDAAARGVFPPDDGGTTVVPQHAHRHAGVIAFTAHAVVFTDEDERWVRGALAAVDCDPLAAALHPRFLVDFMARTGRVHDTVDALLVGAPLPDRPPLALREIADSGHPRVAAARGHRDQVRAWAADGGVVALGRGVAGRLEVSVEVAEGARHRGLGRDLVAAALRLADEPVWAQVSPGNARSLRAFLAAGYRPVGAEALLSATARSADCSGSRS
ncbi:GNAT family N-acetyltransferase [Streptomyces shenzhenensis]|uniref:GNAT family N-acetyltransferase n=1 Tax=Streptomyces shenzhenensis TaxID=943815 RepID=A0A3M0I615_9ACTN|nr:GNAT family N-acetyltransferase [Streptomyces shenzhenensis]RMB84305.1 GNAT family N-acetyltransferase [Streptomyces shenzhenensis]